jgi:hypothetical protein
LRFLFRELKRPALALVVPRRNQPLVQPTVLTWTRELDLHPHVHCIVTGGGLSLDELQWVGSRPNFLLPIEVMSVLFRDKMLAKLKTAWQQGQLDLGQTPVDPEALPQLLDRLYRMDWVAYAKRPFGGPAQVLRYRGST